MAGTPNWTAQSFKAVTASDPFRIGVTSDKKDEEEPIGPFGFFLLGFPLVTLGLGTWQVYRRKWKLELIENLKSRTTSTPVEFPEDYYELESMEYYPVRVRGEFLHDKEFTIGPKSLIVDGAGASEGKNALITQGQAYTGYYVITPFKLQDRDLTILVNRGWVSRKKKNPVTRPEGQISGPVEITGIVRLSETRPQFIPENKPNDGIWYYRDLDAMSELTGAAPIYLEQIYDESVPGGPRGGQTRITLRNEHLSYMITWYSLSAITSWMWYRQFIQKLPLL
ncbi:surfeit locus protein 1 isoform X2 [Cephus cinctus]|uniref:SURF1-like protein n=1 Tax=Cephus cinctus TaxID=211228 RepID=A0AAJ7FHR0_CEPCN|nr:surfeit locus protein 1 isoform X2 [Cephus cinctus]